MSRPQLPKVPSTFDWEKFRADGHKLIDFIADLQIQLAKNPESIPITPNVSVSQQQRASSNSNSETTNIQERPLVSPGFLTQRSNLRQHLEMITKEIEQQDTETGGDKSSNNNAFSQEQLCQQWKDEIHPYTVHWNHPKFFAYFPAIVNPQALLSDLLADSFGAPGFSWTSNPPQTELEQLVMDFLAERAFCFPNKRFSWSSGSGCGVIQACATSSTITSMVAAKMRALDANRVTAGDDAKNLGKLVVYFTDQSHFCVEKAAKVLGIQHVRKLKTVFTKDVENFPMSCDDLERAIQEDIARGLIPFFISGNYGATSTVAIDPLLRLGETARKYKCWFHVDAAYSGSALLLEEVRESFPGGYDEVFSLVDSIQINASKWLGLLMNASFLFSSDAAAFPRALSATGVYLTQNAGAGANAVDLKDYQLGMGRNFRSYKVFQALQTTGVSGWKNVVRRHMMLAQELDRKLKGDSRFEVVTKTAFGLVCFRVRFADPTVTMKLAEDLNASGKAYVITTSTFGGPAIRVAFCHPAVDYKDVDELFELICEQVKIPKA
jgi:aromatic-L-amino-acid decarboxylase